jgi:hypothetical protein
MVSTAEYFIGNLIAFAHIADNNLLTFGHHNAVHGSGVVCGARSAPAESFNLQGVDAVRKLDKSCRAWEEFGSEVSKDSEGIDINT